ncbi:MAG: 2,3-bisphosphoglycerate-independent phosphoglycerate mutase [Desulfurivibrio sp.]|nr:MAG: 2,3-bisphosphoglycerate-independent phosphoglycerate mutase [Desulfurivibrio sp.]
MARCCILVLLDGLGDRAYASLQGKTPLQAASTPHLDRLASMGCNGLFQALRPGLALPSENAHFAMFGYEQSEFPGRGYLEAAGAGLAPGPRDVALLAHFVSLAPQGNTLRLISHRPRATADEQQMLAALVAPYRQGEISVGYHRTHGLDGIVTMQGPVSAAVTDSDPLETDSPLVEVEPWQEAAGDQQARDTAAALKAYLLWCHARLADHPLNAQRRKKGKPEINGIVTQRAGRWRQVDSFRERWGLQGLSISSGLMYWGLAAFIGMDWQQVTDSADPGRDLAQRLRLARGQAAAYEFIHVHSKAPDVAGHSKDPFNKVAAIESLDRGLGRVIEELLDDEIVLAVTADHSTPSAGPLVHSGEPVPFTVAGPGIRRDNVFLFDEVCCAGGALGMLRGADLMYLVLNWLDRAKLQGLMDTPRNQPYWPGSRRPLLLG